VGSLRIIRTHGSRRSDGGDRLEQPQLLPGAGDLAHLLHSYKASDAIRDSILKGDTSAFFKAVEIVHGKARQAVEVNQAGRLEIRWTDDFMTRLEEGRKRVADARNGPDDD
jgi:hypothetical protein